MKYARILIAASTLLVGTSYATADTIDDEIFVYDSAGSLVASGTITVEQELANAGSCSKNICGSVVVILPVPNSVALGLTVSTTGYLSEHSGLSDTITFNA